MVFRNGIFKVVYEDGDDGGGPGGEHSHALIVLRNGTLIGSDPNGAVFTGAVDASGDGIGRADITLTVPPFGELISGFSAGASGAKVRVSATFDPEKLSQRAILSVEGVPVAVSLHYVGALPE